MCVSALHPFQDSFTEAGSVVAARQRLENLIKSRSLDDIVTSAQEDTNEVKIKMEAPDDDDNNDGGGPDDCSNYNPVRDWVNDIRSSAETLQEPSRERESNAFFAKDFIDRFMVEMYEFSL